MKKLHRLLCVLPILTASAYAQEKPINIEVEAQAIGTTNDVVPFWMRSNQYGSIPSAGASGSLIGRINKDYDRERPKKFDWGFGFEGRGNAGKDSRFILIEGYAKAKAGIFQLKAGRTKDVMGLNGDTTLSSGNFAVSGNALGIPKIEISIPEYWRVPIFDGLFSIKGNFSHGWLGRVNVLDTIMLEANETPAYLSLEKRPQTFFHQKSFYMRIGKKDWKINLIGGFNHQVFWGNERSVYGKDYELSNTQTFFKVITGLTYGNGNIPRSKIGNQIGSIDIGADYRTADVKLQIYHQFFYDVGALAKLANIRDGLTGFSIRNERVEEQTSLFKWHSALLEFFYSKHQAGVFDAKPTNSGDEDYYNNYYYTKGWSYYNAGLGNPLITTKLDMRDNLASFPKDYFSNNRVVALHFGFQGSVGNVFLTSKLTYSSNHGTFGTSPEGHSLGNVRFPPKYGLFGNQKQFSGLISARTALSNRLQIELAAATDLGDVLYRSSGLVLKIKHRF